MISHLKQTLFDFIQFLKKPKDEKLSNQNKTQIVITFIILLLFSFLMDGIIGSINYLLENFGFYSTKDHAIVRLMENMPFPFVLITGVVVAPITEELVFRLPLRYKYNVFVKSILLFAKFSSKRKQVRVRLFFTKNWNKYYLYIFYLVTFLFAFYHLVNYKITSNILLFSPLLVLPQFIVGLALGYIRVKYNFFLGILFHAIYNAILFIPMLYIFNIPSERRNETTSYYKIIIKDVKKNSNNEAISTIGTDEIIYENYSLNAVIAELLDKNIDLIETNNNDSFTKKINIKFEQINQSKAVNANKLLSLLSETYHFKIMSNFKFQDVYEMNIFDSVLFNKSSLKYAFHLNSTTNCKNVLKFRNVNLDDLAKSISSVYKLNITNNTGSLSTFNFEIPNGDFNKVNYILKSDYGISLVKNFKTVEFSKVEFPITSEK
ncbi:MAG: CPBP family intramembrane glutamic endopeptidase [Bacteroidia bacterium]